MGSRVLRGLGVDYVIDCVIVSGQILYIDIPRPYEFFRLMPSSKDLNTIKDQESS